MHTIYILENVIALLMKKMLLINGSARKEGSCSELSKMTSEKGAAHGYEVEIVHLDDLKIANCKGCLYCKEHGECQTKDDMIPLHKKVQDADVFGLVTPVYFGAESGLMKNFIDRLYALLDRIGPGQYSVRFGKPKKGIVAVSCGAPDGNMTYHGIMSHLVIILRMFGSADVVSGVIPGAAMTPVRESPFAKDLMDAVDFTLST